MTDDMNYPYKVLKNFLNLYWIRPESAIWRTLDVLVLRNLNFKKPILDIGCGDGTFTFTKFGGEVYSSYDVYRTINQIKGFLNGVDIHNQLNSIKPKISKKPHIKVDVGLDLKKNLLKKAKNLHIYQKLIEHNANNILPFHDDQFNTIFSNTFYWMKNVKHILNESHRITSKNARIIICVPDRKLKKNMVYNQYLLHNYQWAKILDRDNFSHINQNFYTFREWKSIFSDCGLKIEFHSDYISEKLVEFYNFGSRYFSPYIIEMANKLNLKSRTESKTKAVKEITNLSRAYLDYEIKQIDKKNNCFHIFSLKKE